jgi:hypothetical protein
MTIVESLSKRSWLLIVALAIFPFLLRVGLDYDAVQRQAVLSLYRVWRWSPEMRQLRNGSPLIFEVQHEKSSFERDFKAQLQQDFKLVELGDKVPHVRAFFEPGTFLYARVEIEKAGTTEWTAWESKARFVNNGILLGAWVGLLLWILGRSLGVSATIAMAMMLLWQVDWNILEVPDHLIGATSEFIREMSLRFHYHDWTASEMGRLGDLGAVLWLVIAAIVLRFVFSRMSQLKFARNMAIMGLLLEPLAVWTGSLFGNWGGGASWWKVYLGSFAFRFVTLAHLFLGVLRPYTLSFSPNLQDPEVRKLERRRRRHRVPWWVVFIPLVFVYSSGWAWLNSVISPGPGETLLRLKVFFIGFVLSFILGSRIFSLWVGTLALSLILPPSRGHWMAAAWYGLMLDGLFLGWWMTPFKGTLPIIPNGERPMRFGTLTTMAWVIGVFLSSVGAPLGIAWTALILAVWAYAQLSVPLDPGARKAYERSGDDTLDGIADEILEESRATP